MKTYAATIDGVPIAGRIYIPSGGAAQGVVLLIHDNKGLSEYMNSVAIDLVADRYIAVVPDLLIRVGGTSEFNDQDALIAALGTLDVGELANDAVGTARFLVDSGEIHSAIPWAAVGFCFGGTIVWRVATMMNELNAAIPFYGKNPPLHDVPAIQAPVLAIYGERDPRINVGIPDIEAAMSAAGKTFEKRVFPATGHAFHSPANPERHNPVAAAEAWRATRTWLAFWMDRPERLTPYNG